MRKLSYILYEKQLITESTAATVEMREDLLQKKKQKQRRIVYHTAAAAR
jgi:hypothetical protein